MAEESRGKPISLEAEQISISECEKNKATEGGGRNKS